MPLDCSIFDSQWIDHRVTPPCMGANGYRDWEIALFVLAECDYFIGCYIQSFSMEPCRLIANLFLLLNPCPSVSLSSSSAYQEIVLHVQKIGMEADDEQCARVVYVLAKYCKHRMNVCMH